MNPQWVRLSDSLRTGARARPPASRRRHFLSFLGSTDKSDRAARIAAVDAALRGLRVTSLVPAAAGAGGRDRDGGGGGTASGVEVVSGVEAAPGPAATARVFHRLGNVACYGSGCADARYVEETLDSALCLHLPGSSVESNRLYEGLEGGCVPVVLLRFGPGEDAVGTRPSYGERAARAVRAALAPLANVTGAAPPFVVVEHERELAARLRVLASSAAALDGMQAEAAAWWERAKAYYADRMARAVCPAALLPPPPA